MFQKILLKAVFSAATAIAAFFGISQSQAPGPTPVVQEQPLGATIPVVVSLFETSLQGRIDTSATSMTLVSGTDRQGNAISGYACFTIDEGTPSVEFVCGTASGTSISSLTRGIDPVTGVTSVTALKKPHNRGATVKITNYPQLAIISRVLNGADTLPNPLQYGSVSTSTLASNTSYLASVAYVNGIAIAGSPNATTTSQGLVQFATGAQTAVGTVQGSTGAYLVPSNGLFASSTSAKIIVPVTQSSGKLAQAFLDLTESFTFTGTTTLATATVNGVLTVNSPTTTFATFPIVSGTPATSTALTNKSYVDGKFSFGNATTTSLTSSWNSPSATATIASLSFTPSVATRLLITVVMSGSPATTQGHHCTNNLFIDNVDQSTGVTITNSTSGSTAQQNMSFTFVTSQVTAAQHSIKLTALAPDSTTCNLVGNVSLSVLNIGN